MAEYGLPKDVAGEVARNTSLTRQQTNEALLITGSRIAGMLGSSTNPITVTPNGVRAADIAGLIRLSPWVELEIAPKFLGVDDIESTWREDFFFLSTISRHGRLIPRERISASGSAQQQLATLVAQALIEMFEANKRRPLRTYRRAIESSFYIDGDPDPLDLMLPDAEGFRQQVTKFDRANIWNATIFAAARSLVPEIRDPGTISKLNRLIEELAPQAYPSSIRQRTLPARHRAWQSLFDLSADVLNGLGLAYLSGSSIAPGFVVSTWRLWEDVLRLGSRIGFGRTAVSTQQGFKLGSRTKEVGPQATKPVNVVPDFIIDNGLPEQRFILDAKYKGNVESGQVRIAEADIYESMAFAKATGCEKVVLVYPAQLTTSPGVPGSCTVFERVSIDTLSIVGVEVEVRGISKRGALYRFGKMLRDGVCSAIEMPVAA